MDDSENAYIDLGLKACKRRKIESPTNPAAPRPNSECYEKHEKRGIALIFSHMHFCETFFTTKLESHKDADDLREVLGHLNFDVKVYNNHCYHQVMDVLTEVSQMDHTKHDCLLITVLTYNELGMLYARDEAYFTRELWTPFIETSCPSLAGKPKLFFIQACDGYVNLRDPVPSCELTESASIIAEGRHNYSIPLIADVLIMYSTAEGSFSWRDPENIENGSCFIQSLVHQLKKHYKVKDLVSILTCVNGELASITIQDPQLSYMKEMCCIASTLTRFFYLD